MYMCVLHLHIRVCIHMYKKNWKRRRRNIAGILFIQRLTEEDV